MPAEQGKDAERFAAAMEQGRTPGSVDGELRRDLEIVAMLRSRSAAYAPDPDAKARARQRLMSVLAEPDARGRPPRAVPPSSQEQTAPLGRIVPPAAGPGGGAPRPGDGAPRTGDRAPRHDAGASEATARLSPVTRRSGSGPSDPTAAETTTEITGLGAPAPVPAAARPGRRPGRHTLPNRPARPAGSRRPAATGLRRRAVLVGSAALVMMVALAGGGIFASRDALPGDNLYAVKRAAESAGLALTFGEEAKARRHLELATTRLDEVERMVARRSPAAPPAGAAESEPEPELLSSAIDDFDAATGEGSRMLLTGDDTADAAAIGDLRAWAADQAARLTALRPALPVPAVAGADDSIELLDRLLGRTEALEDRSSCTEVTSGAVDDLGPLPAQGTCAPRPAAPSGDEQEEGDDPRIAEDGAPEAGITGNGDTPAAPTVPDTTGTTGNEAVTGTPTPGTGTPTGAPTPTPSADERSGLLPGVEGPDLGGLPGRVGTSQGGTPESSTSQTRDSLSVPLPLLPPITLPPLLPGQPGITIG